MNKGGRGDCSEKGSYSLEDQIGFLIRRAHQRATAVFNEVMTDSGLSPLQFAALVKLRDCGEVSQNLLGRYIAADRATVQGVVKRLMERNLIVREPDKNDRRRAVLSLSEAGARVLGQAVPLGPVVTARTLAPLTPEECVSLMILVRKLA